MFLDIQQCVRIAKHFTRKQQVRTTGCSNVCTSSWPRLYVKIYYNIHESLHGAVCSFIHSFTHSFMGSPLSTWLCPRQWTWGTPVYLWSSCPGQGHLLPALDLLLPLAGFLVSRHALHHPLLKLFPYASTICPLDQMFGVWAQVIWEHSFICRVGWKTPNLIWKDDWQHEVYAEALRRTNTKVLAS